MSLSLSLLLAAAAQSTVPPATPPSAKPERICRESERQTGSHIRSARRCKTAEQWRIEDERRDRVPADMRVTEGQNDLGPTRPQ